MATKNNAYEIKNRIKELRVDKNITQEELARAVGVSRQTILFMEKGKYYPSLFLAFLIAEFFAVNINDVFYIVRKGR